MTVPSLLPSFCHQHRRDLITLLEVCKLGGASCTFPLRSLPRRHLALVVIINCVISTSLRHVEAPAPGRKASH